MNTDEFELITRLVNALDKLVDKVNDLNNKVEALEVRVNNLKDK